MLFRQGAHVQAPAGTAPACLISLQEARLFARCSEVYASVGCVGCLQSLCRAAGEVVDATLKAVNKDPEDEPPLDVVAALYSDKTAGKADLVARSRRVHNSRRCFEHLPACQSRKVLLDSSISSLQHLTCSTIPLGSRSHAGKDWMLDTDFEAAGQQIQRGYLSMLAIDSLLAFMGSVEKLTDYALDQSGDVPATLSKGPGYGERGAQWVKYGWLSIGDHL